MPKAASSNPSRRNVRLASFTLIELLVVIAIIAILAALILSAASGVMTKASRSRAASEIQAMSNGLDNYKIDNGAYPTNTAFSTLLTNTYSTTDGSVSGGLYQLSSQALFLALTGYTNYYDTPVAGTKSYMTFKTSQLGNYISGSGTTYVKDPWGFSYGYSPGTSASYPYAGTGFFDIWSTGGLTTASTQANPTNTWVVNWQ